VAGIVVLTTWVLVGLMTWVLVIWVLVVEFLALVISEQCMVTVGIMMVGWTDGMAAFATSTMDVGDISARAHGTTTIASTSPITTSLVLCATSIATSGSHAALIAERAAATKNMQHDSRSAICNNDM